MVRLPEVHEADSRANGALRAFLLVSLKEQWRVYRKKFKRCQKEASEETVHEFRIASRRMLSILNLLEGLISKKRLQTAQDDLTKRLKCLGRLRDTHTQLSYVRKLRHNFPEARSYYKTLEKRACRLTRRVGRKLPHLKTGRLGESIGAIKRQLRCLRSEDKKEKVFELALQTLQRAYAKVVDCYRAIEF